MNPLFNVNIISKQLIQKIVDGFRETSRLIDEDKSTPHYGPGLMFRQLFYEDDCSINIFEGEHKSIAIELEFSKETDEGLSTGELIEKHAKFGGKKKSNFIEKLIYLKSLYENGLIYFSEERKENTKISLPFYTSSLKKEEQFKDKMNYMTWFISYPSLYQFICRFYYSNVIPLSSLISFYDNGYVTEEEKRYNKQVQLSEESLRIANESLSQTKSSIEIANASLAEAKQSNKLAKKANCRTLYMAIATILISGFISWLCASHIPTSIHDSFSNQLNNNLERIILIDSVANENLYNIQNRLDSIEINIKQPQIKPIKNK